MRTYRDILNMPPSVVNHGHLGLEVEVEFTRSVTTDVAKQLPIGWSTHVDNSLRNNGLEFVTNGNTRIDDAHVLLDSLYKMLVGLDTVGDSPRTSFHVHVNMLDKTPTATAAALVRYWLLEPFLIPMCGKYRKHNLFCLPLTEAAATIKNLAMDHAAKTPFSSLTQNNAKYGSVNLGALVSYGTLEFRSMDGSINVEQKKLWVDLLYEIAGNPANDVLTPKQISDMFFDTVVKDKDPYGFIDKILPSTRDARTKRAASAVRAHMPADPGAAVKAMLNNMLIILPFINAVPNWSTFMMQEPTPAKKKSKNPLRRDDATFAGAVRAGQLLQIRPLMVDNPDELD